MDCSGQGGNSSSRYFLGNLLSVFDRETYSLFIKKYKVNYLFLGGGIGALSVIIFTSLSAAGGNAEASTS